MKNQNTSDLWLREARNMLRLALPLIAAALAQMGMEIVDALMMGRLGPVALAAGSLAGALFMSLVVILFGIMNAVGVLVAREYGANNLAQASVILRQGFILVAIMSIPAMYFLWDAHILMLKIGEEPLVVASVQEYLHGLVWAIPAMFGFMALREFVSAVAKPHVVMVVALSAIPVNAFGNYILMYGKFGLPNLGIYGIGVASSITEWLMFLAIVGYVHFHRVFSQYQAFKHFELPRLKMIGEILKIGVPNGALFGLEVGLFSVTSIMMGYFGADALAAHQIVLQTLAAAFMIPLGLAQATAVRVGHAMGARHRDRAKRAAYVGILLALFIAILSAAIFWLFPQAIIALFINVELPQNQPVINHAITFLDIAAIFVIMDGLQAVAVAILRALKDTVMPMVLGLISYWCIGWAGGYWLAFHRGMAGAGLWWGLALGISATAFLLLLRFHFSIKYRN